MQKLLEQLCESRPIVPRKFTHAHAIMTLLRLREEPSLGRYILQERLGLSEASVRSLLKLLKKHGLIQVLSQRKGHRLSVKGEEFIQWLTERIVPVREMQLGDLIPEGSFSAGYIVRDASSLVTSGIEQRDDAIRMGALGAITLIVDRTDIRFPSDEPAMADYAVKKLEEIRKAVSEHIKHRDVIMIGWGQRRVDAEIGAITAAIKLLYTLVKNPT